MSKKEDINFLSAYLVVGDDKLKQQRVEERLNKRLSEHGDMSFNTQVFDAGAGSCGNEVVAACQTIPFASEYRLTKIRNAEKLTKACSEAIISYLNAPTKTSILILFATKLAKNTRLYKAISKLGKTAIITCQTPKKQTELSAIVRDMAIAHGVTLTPDAAHELVSLVGGNTVKLNAELKKLAIAHSSANPISKQEVASQVACIANPKWWEFVDAISSRDAKQSLLLLSRMKNESPYSLLPRTTARIRQLIGVKTLLKSGDIANIPAAIKLPANMKWKIKDYKFWAQKYTSEELKRAIISARDTEASMKSGTNPNDAFYEWVVGVLSCKPKFTKK